MADKRILLKILTPEGPILETFASSVRMKLADGRSIGIRSGHGDLIAATAPGQLIFVDEKDNTRNLNVESGILQIKNHEIYLYTILQVSETSPESSALVEEGLDAYERLMEELYSELNLDL